MTDYKGLCRELVLLDQAEPGDYADWRQAWNAAIERACAALAESEPEWLTDEELLQDWDFVPGARAYKDDLIDFARAVLARWGNHPESPDSSTQPVPVTERLPESEDCDAKGRCRWWYPEVPGKTYGYWSHEDDAVPDRALDEQPSHWLPAHALPVPSHG